jgi:hypothetical protein
VEHVFGSVRNVAVAPVPQTDAEILEAWIRPYRIVVRQKFSDWNVMPLFGESITVE